MEKIDKQAIEILNNKFAEHLPDLYQKDVVLEAMMEYGQHTYTTRNDEVVAMIEECVESNKQAYASYGLSEFKAIAIDMSILLTKLKEDKK